MSAEELFSGHRPRGVDAPEPADPTDDLDHDPAPGATSADHDAPDDHTAPDDTAPDGTALAEDGPAPHVDSAVDDDSADVDSALDDSAPDVDSAPDDTAVDDTTGDDVPDRTTAPASATSTADAPARPVSWRDELDPDATTVIPLTAVAGRSDRAGRDDTPTDVWDTGTIRRWDSSMTDNRTRTADSEMHRPYRLDDRDDVSLDDEEQGGRWYEVPLMVIIALTLAFLLRTFVVQVFYIPSGSMIPTLEINDRIAVEKLSYLARDPARGEVVVFAGDDPFSEPSGASTGDRLMTGVGQFLGVVPVDAKDFVKRVIGLPGDTVVLTDGVVTVNGVELDEPYARLDQDNGEWVVPDGSLFVMGDNRGNSGDSRSSLGYIPVDDVVGRAVVTIWPLERAGSVPGVDHGAAVDAGS